MEITKAKVLVFLFIASTIFVLYAMNYLEIVKMRLYGLDLRTICAWKTNSSNETTPTANQRRVILLYTTFFGIKDWLSIPTNCPGDPCPLDIFEVTLDKQRLGESEFIVFHARDMPSLDHLKMLLKCRRSSQFWVYFLMESPNHTPDTGPLNGLFNLTWTYRTDSDIWAPYGSYVYRELSNGTADGIPRFISKQKSKLVTWMVSNCGPALRKEFVHELQKYIKVDVFGSCSDEFGLSRSCDEGSSGCKSTISQYKFYLAFENSLCEDYITEKYWGNLDDKNVVPVVMGGANYSKLAIPGSYINVMDFKTVKQLAEYLQYLDKNETAYNEYFRWREKNIDSTSPPLFCRLCMACTPATSPKPKVYFDLTDYWFRQGKCNEKDGIIRNMWQS